MVQRTALVSTVFTLFVAAGCGNSTSGSEPASVAGSSNVPTKVYVAVEDDGVVAVLDGADLRLRTTIPMGDFMAHNVQVAPDGRSVWVTLPAMEMDGGMPMSDQVAVIDPATDTIVARIDLGPEVHPAHVVLSSDGSTAFVTGATKNELIRIDTATRAVIDRTALGHGEGAHGARLSPDGATIWVAEVGGKCVAAMPRSGGPAQHVMLNGEAVQVAVTSDGRWVFASQYDTKQVARIDVRTRDVTYVSLPAGSQGPAQVYPSPDGRSILVADQGLLEGRPASNRLVFLDADTTAVTDMVLVGDGAHGVVTSGDRAYVTAAQAGTVSAIDLRTHTVIATASVGHKPNGVSAWSPGVGTP